MTPAETATIAAAVAAVVSAIAALVSLVVAIAAVWTQAHASAPRVRVRYTVGFAVYGASAGPALGIVTVQNRGVVPVDGNERRVHDERRRALLQPRPDELCRSPVCTDAF